MLIHAPATRPFPFSRKTMLIAGAPVVVLLLTVLVLLLRRSSAPMPSVVQELPVPPPPVEVVAPAPAPAPVEIPAPPAVVPTLSGKPVVLEYDAGPDAAAVAGADPDAVARARDANRKGNARLTAGDKKGALKAYRAALKIYPGYVGAYRGLGRLLMVSGDKKTAIKAFKLYLKTVPDAEDAASINALIEKLQKKPPARHR